ncbi:FAD binding domain-containing protein [Colletotrichum fioriniae PJ7]|uniref:FAD binding domain-containing protein n=1 Tax=Colletotrichum fioriniae PJ7 TaxID=1445577 RepID=A0A010S0W2_9PEZI|nr:FAD binding domain-containing protein [Colletotrichum fioriniae PJ7]
MANPTSSRHPLLTTLFTTIFALLAAAGVYFIRIQPGHTSFTQNLTDLVETEKLQDGSRLYTTYTGLKPLDLGLTYLVASFAQGPLNLNEAARIQQIHFLLNFFPAVVVFNVEAYRSRNRWSFLSFHAAWAALYQTVGGGVIIPLYHLAYTLLTTRKTYLVSSGDVPLPLAKALLPASLLLFALPTAAMYYPWTNPRLAQNLIAFWQVAPVLVNAGIWLLASTIYKSSPKRTITPEGKTTTTTTTRKQAALVLRRLYSAAILVASASHFYTLYTIFTPQNKSLTLSNVFLPLNDISTGDVGTGLFQLFQWDFWLIFGSSRLWCALVVYDVQKQQHGKVDLKKFLAYYVLANNLEFVVGPGAVLAGVWRWREERLVEIEAEAGRLQKEHSL